MPRPPVEKTRKLAQAEELGKLQAQEKMRKKHAKLSWKKLEISVIEHIGKFLDRMTVDDALKLSSIATLTIVIKPLIQGSAELVQRAAGMSGMFSLSGIQALTKSATLRPLFGADQQFDFVLNPVPWTEGNMLSEPVAWILSFATAVLIVQFGPEMLASIGGVVKIAGLLFA